MDAEQQKEWGKLEQQARELLRRGNTPSRFGVRALFQVLVLPSFGAASGWEICEDRKAQNHTFAVHSIWRRETDLAKLENPVIRMQFSRPLVPTMDVWQYPLETDWVESTRSALQSVMIPAMVESDVVGCDGTFYEVAFDAGFMQARYIWWEEPPTGWRPLHLWLQQTLEALRPLAINV